jgi:hypothetical protein
MKKSTFQKNIILSLAVLTAFVSVMVLITAGAERKKYHEGNWEID